MKTRARAALTCAVLLHVMGVSGTVWANEGTQEAVSTADIHVEADAAKEEAKYESQSTTIITAEDIAKKQAKSVEDIIFDETGMTRNIDAMGRVTVSIRGAEPRHTLILIDGQPVLGDFAKYSGAGDELQRLGTENVARIEIIRGAASAKYGADAIGGVVNVITKDAAKKAGLQLNLEGRRTKGDSDVFPYANFFLRADSGQQGKFRIAAYGGRRDILPVYGVRDSMLSDESLVRNSLRYYGDIKNIGMTAAYDITKNHSLSFSLDRVSEEMNRYVKRSNSFFEPQQHFKRDVDRDNYRLSYEGRGGASDWNVSLDYAKMHEDDITLTSYVANRTYMGTNILDYVDNLEHRQLSLKASANTQINDNHLLSYGVGFIQEKGEGSRLKNAPNTYTRAIDPWDYDKNLYVGRDLPTSRIHDYTMMRNDAGVPKYDNEYEWYGHKDTNGKNLVPQFTYEEFLKYGYQHPDTPADVAARRAAFGNALRADPANSYLSGMILSPEMAVYMYYNPEAVRTGTGHTMNWRGKAFKDEYYARQNRQTIGTAEIKKQYIFVQDTWQVNDRTLLSPILRVDNSNLFGTHMTFNIGMTHNIGGKTNRRFKANLGTGYTEPGMGELYYNWEMYAGAPVGEYRARLGRYWVGNPELKPEKSVNFDIGLEGESKGGKDSFRIDAFHNRIRNYMTTYFTGYLMDFHPELKSDGTRLFFPPDMIYSFKNIGRAEITGLEAEYNHRFDRHWSTKLGYTYLHAINKSDPTMPDRLLDRPQHKIDLGITYENAGWRATLWGNYYLNMLDSNSIANNGNYIDDVDNKWQMNFHVGGTQTYEKKSFGIWNFILQKDLGKDSSAYIGVDNILNHRDDDRAFQERMYRLGVNLKFGPDADTVPMSAEERAARTEANNALLEKKARFIIPPFDMEKEIGTRVIGDYRWRWNSFTGKEKPANARTTPTSTIGSAYKNYLEKAGHGFEQRLRAGVDARLDENTNITVLGSLASTAGVDTETDAAQSKGLNHARLDTADVTRHAKEWDFSLGRLTEPLGITGYYFGKEYDGGRAVWTGKRTQVRLGYGDFRRSTGIADSAYTHAVTETFYRAPTVDEFIKTPGMDSTNPLSFYEQMQNATTQAEQQAIVKRMFNIVKQAYPNVQMKSDSHINGLVQRTTTWVPLTRYDRDAGVNDDTAYQPQIETSSFDTAALDYPTYKAYLQAWFQKEVEQYGTEDGVATNQLRGTLNKQIRKIYEFEVDDRFYDPVTTPDQFRQNWYTALENWINALPDDYTGIDDPDYLGEAGKANPSVTNLVDMYWQAVRYTLEEAVEDGTDLPRVGLGNVVGKIIKTTGTVLECDRIPAIKQAAYMQVRHEVTPNLGVAAFYLRSLGGNSHTFRAANGTGNDVDTFDTLANVVGVGARYRLTKNAALSFDYGANFTDFGRYMNGHTRYEHASGMSDFAVKGRERGNTPTFWVMRLDVGQADMDVAGSWNAFIDYKRFEHGSFFGGNGTESLPDRYLDGIRSFTIGAGYVPVQNLMVEAFYTFGAKGINTRDTLYGPEHFRLGDYARMQVTYRF